MPGYSGAHVVRHLRRSGYRVVVVEAKIPEPGVLPHDAAFVQAPVTNVSLLSQTLRDHAVNGLMHLAACKAVPESVRNPLHYYRQNINGLLGVLEAMHSTGVRQMVFASWVAVYCMAGEEAVSEDAPLRPVNPYGETKLICERIIGDAARAHPLATVCLRYSNVAGAASPFLRDRGACGLVAVAAQALWQDRPVTVNGRDDKTVDGTCVRDYIHVEDLAAAHVLIADAFAAGVYDGRVGAVYTSPPAGELRCLRF